MLKPYLSFPVPGDTASLAPWSVRKMKACMRYGKHLWPVFYLRRIWKGYRRQTTISFHYLQLGSLERKIKLYLMKAKSIKGKSLQEIESGLHQAIADGLKPTLAL